MSEMGIIDRDLRTLLFCSFRYALGRRSYLPGLMQDMIKTYSNVLSVADRIQMSEEIDNSFSLGDPKIDEPRWREFQAWLRA